MYTMATSRQKYLAALVGLRNSTADCHIYFYSSFKTVAATYFWCVFDPPLPTLMQTFRLSLPTLHGLDYLD